MLDVSEAIQHMYPMQRKNRGGMQHRRGATNSSPVRVSSPAHSQAPASPAPYQAAANNSSPTHMPKQSSKSLGPAKAAPASSNLSRMQQSKGAVCSSPMHVSSPAHSPAVHQAAANNKSPGQAPKVGASQQVGRSPSSAREVPGGSGLSQMAVQVETIETAQPASANGSAPAEPIQCKPVEDMPGEHVCIFRSPHHAKAPPA